MRGSYPDVPISPEVDFEGLVAPDREAGEEPFFITLPLGEYNQVSRNKRKYVEDVAIKAIHGAITTKRITGQTGHTAEERRAWEFKVPVLHWVGAIIQDGVVWGKAYVPRSAMDVREYYRVSMRTNATVGTSLEGWGYQEWDEEAEMWNIYELDVNRIDAVGPEGVGIPKAGSMPPKISTEKAKTTEAVAPGELAVGDFVSWEDNGSLIRGQVNTIWEDGEVEVPWSDSPAIKATPDDPIARMDVYRPNYDTGEWIRADWQQVRYFSQLTKLEAMPELQQTDEPPFSESEDQEGDETMATEAKKKPEEQTVDARLIEMQEEYDEQIRALNLEVTTLERSSRTFDRLCKMLDVKEGDDPVLALQARLTSLEAAQKENSDLLATAIESEVKKFVKVEWAQPTVIENVTQMHPQSRAEVISCVQEALKNPNVVLILKNAVQKEMGPNVTPQTEMNPGADGQDQRAGAIIPS